MEYRDSYASVGQLVAPVERILGVWLLVSPPGKRTQGFSHPGHMLHLVLQGRYRVTVRGRSYEMKPGMMITYYEAEETIFEAYDEQVAFYSTAFVAPSIRPLNDSNRCFQADQNVADVFRDYHQASFDPQPELRDMRMWAGLYGLLAAIRQQVGPCFQTDVPGGVRQQIENALRKRGIFRPTIEMLCDICHCSKSTLIRRCREETQMTPMRLVQRLRMGEARCLLLHAMWSVTQIAEYLGYPRMHEFSREFAAYYGCSPTNYTWQADKEFYNPDR